jgi:hypothetical protein
MIRRLCAVAAASLLLSGCGWYDDWFGRGPTEDPTNPGYSTTGEPMDTTTTTVGRPPLSVPPMLRDPTMPGAAAQ